MAETPNIDKWDLSQTFPREAMAKCPYCSSTEVYDPFTVKDKVLRFLVFLFWFGWWPLFVRRENDAAYPRRRCAACGFEYNIETNESLLCWIGLIVILVSVAVATLLLYRDAPP
jgi:uncharacterized protein (DUF983 family)